MTPRGGDRRADPGSVTLRVRVLDRHGLDGSVTQAQLKSRQLKSFEFDTNSDSALKTSRALIF